ncbi:HTTM domain-containing protein [Maribacter polysaccharolyticus]|uniref:HTTM domain-containing protein n=1 Tax=Maribacter polysaccharolyticus TaxID=3020831 RepID=UPI00237FB120|nr:HTTM domain-containing protein [Maribacter polysaccharolyticus]MDE3742463.1 HTTM domain-containing protein [Maribacter polysaccharolyticus]
MLKGLFFSKIDNAPLLIFRVFFGILIALESFGAIVTGWIKSTLIIPKFTFSFIGFEFLQPLPGPGMYFYFIIMGTLGILIALGYKYRWSIIAFTVLWLGVYLMQKSSYNNHYYLLFLISLMMCFFPANTGLSIDARQNADIRTNVMFSYVKWMIVAQLFIVYTYASVAKLYGDWLDFSVIESMMQSKNGYPIIGPILQQPWVHKTIAVTGIVFDALIVPALLWKPTRKTAFIIAIFFHISNSVIFQIGIFPYLALAFTVFFFDPNTIRSIFFKDKKPRLELGTKTPSSHIFIIMCCSLYILVQIILPVRHHFIEDHVLWTEEGHRLSWRMMLRNRVGKIHFKVVNHTSGKTELVQLKDHLTRKQLRKVAAYPDFIWQFSHYLRQEYRSQGDSISVYAHNSQISINGKPYKPFINPAIDLANEKWDHFKHHDWILPSDLDDQRE